MTLVPITHYTRRDQGLLNRDWRFGELDPVQFATLHHTAGPSGTTKARTIALHKQYDADHAAKGWGGIGYHLAIDSLGRTYDLRPRFFKGAHTGGDNSNNFGITVHGNYMVQKLNPLQRRTIKALYRGDVKGFEFLGHVPWYGHQERPGHSTNACPGKNQMSFLRWLRSTKR